MTSKPEKTSRTALWLGIAVAASVGIALVADAYQDTPTAAVTTPAAEDPAVAEQQPLPPNHPPIDGMNGDAVMDGEELPPGHPPIDGQAAAGDGEMPPGHPPTQAGDATVTVEPGSITAAEGDGAVTVAKLFGEAKSYEGKKVRLRAKVLRMTANVLGKTWLHVADGTGSADKGNNDLVVTTQASPNIGDVVLLEDAELRRDAM